MPDPICDTRPIGVFDSGVGGLTVLDHISRLLPDESTVYLGDTARVPYGARDPETVRRYSLECGRALVSRANAKMLVVACNTASAVALPAMEREFSVPVVGVIRPGARAALQASRGGGIAVLGTAGTIRSGAYAEALATLGYRGLVIGRACPMLVPLVEAGWLDGVVPMLTLDRYLGDLVSRVDALVLGCTHYPLLRPLIRQMAPESVAIVDGGSATAVEVQDTLRTNGLRAPRGCKATHRIWVTDSVEGMSSAAPRFLASVDQRAMTFRHVDVTLPEFEAELESDGHQRVS